MPDIVLATLNARYAHCSLALRYLLANLGQLEERAVLREFIITERPCDIAEALLALAPRILGLGVYIWNASQSLELVRILKRVRPDLIVVLGGPEVSHEYETQEVVRLADHVITGEADLAFPELCARILSGRRPLSKVIAAAPPEPAALASPYRLYSDRDLRERVVYVEASRGCPFSCEFCLSSLDTRVRSFPLERFLGELDALHRRGLRRFKFIDRTFNLNLRTAHAILAFFRDRLTPELFVHFEMVPDRFPEALRALVAGFPAGALQFEVGIQTFDPAVAARISRRLDAPRVVDNLRFLRDSTGVHIHADLIAGLPGEDLDGFARGFDQLVALRPQEIQVGILKRLRGTPITRHDVAWGMVYADSPPYEVLCTAQLDFATLQMLKRFARAWDLVGNSGNFRDTTPLLWHDRSPFAGFLAFTCWLHRQIGAFSGVALLRLTALLFDHLVGERGLAPELVARSLAGDYTRPGRRLPDFLAARLPAEASLPASVPRSRPALPPRQARHL
jgi:radical SAM superfamily enzyme YgiQ (UPF0313 family)